MDRNFVVKVLIVDDDSDLVCQIRKKFKNLRIIFDQTASIENMNCLYDFYILGDLENIEEHLEKIRKSDKTGEIILFDNVGEKQVSLKKTIKWGVSSCIQKDIKNIDKLLRSFYATKSKMHEASCKLDYLKSGDLATLTKKLKKAGSDQFVDYIQNHSLPMVLVDCECKVLHANEAMEAMIGMKLPGLSASAYWENSDDFDGVVCTLKKEGHILGREVTLKTSDNDLLQMKLYTSIHCDSSGNWINTRCLFVPSN